MTVHRYSLLAALLLATGLPGLAQPGIQEPPPPQAQGPAQTGQGQGNRGQRQGQPRDRAQMPQGTGSVAGRVLAADTGRPVKRARVTVSGAGAATRAATTDDLGRYQVADLGAATYTISASRSGFVDAVYGQRRPEQPGTPVVLADGQAAASIDLRLIRAGVLTGRVVDEDGEALARALVTVQRYQYVRGERQLLPAGGDQTDDRGQYRVFGLPPGDYYVSATNTGLEQLLGRGLQQLAAGIAAAGGRGGGRGGPGGLADLLGGSNEPESTGYAPTYFPGVVTASEAGRVNVGPGQEVAGVDFQIQVVPLATVSGVVTGADDVVPVVLIPEDASGRGPLGGSMFSGRAQADGTFRIANVPPGRYIAVARSGGRNSDPKTGMQSIVVNGQNMDGVSLALQPGLTLSGNITVESSGTPAPADYSVFRVDVPDVTPLPLGGGGRGGGGAGGSRVDKNGAFEVASLLPGRHYIRVTGGGGQAPGQWTLKSVTVAGQDVTDHPLELKPGQNLDSVSVVLTDRSTEITGTVRDRSNAAAAALTVIVFPTDPQYWRAQSRHIQTARTDAAGAFRLRALPPGDYLIVATDNVEQGEWFDPAYLEQARATATRVTVTEGEKKTLDLKAPS